MSLDQEYINNLKNSAKNQQNSNFDKFLHEKILENEADRRIRLQKTSKEQFSLQTRESAMKRYSQSPNQATVMQNYQTELSHLSKGQKRRQIDTTQMLLDLKESMKVRDQRQLFTNTHMATRAYKPQQTLGEKMSLAGDLETTVNNNASEQLQYEQAFLNNSYNQDLSNHETFSSKQYRGNPLLLDDQVLLSINEMPTEPSRPPSLPKKAKSAAKEKKFRTNDTNLQQMGLAGKKKQDKDGISDDQMMQKLHNHQYDTSTVTTTKKHSIVLQLEPKQLLQKSENKIKKKLQESIQRKKQNQFQQQNMTMEDQGIYVNQTDDLFLKTNSGDHSDFEAVSHKIHSRDALQNRMQIRPKTNKSSYKKSLASLPMARSTLDMQNLDEMERNIDYIFQGNHAEKQQFKQQIIPKKMNLQSTSGASMNQQKQPSKLPEAYEMEMKKQMQNSRSAFMLEKALNFQKQIFNNDLNQENNNTNYYEYKLPPKTRKTNYQNGFPHLERSQDFKTSSGLLQSSSTAMTKPTRAAHLEFSKTKVVYKKPSFLKNQASSGLSDIHNMSKIKVQNLHKVNKKSFENMGNRSTVMHTGMNRGGSQKSKLYKTQQNQNMSQVQPNGSRFDSMDSQKLQKPRSRGKKNQALLSENERELLGLNRGIGRDLSQKFTSKPSSKSRQSLKKKKESDSLNDGSLLRNQLNQPIEINNQMVDETESLGSSKQRAGQSRMQQSPLQIQKHASRYERSQRVMVSNLDNPVDLVYKQNQENAIYSIDEINIKNVQSPVRNLLINPNEKQQNNQKQTLSSPQQRSRSSKEELSPSKQSDQSIHQTSDFMNEQQNQLSPSHQLKAKKIKHKQKNNRSKKFFVPASQRNNRSQFSSKEFGQNTNSGENHCQRCSVALDAQVAALNLSQPIRYQSVMQHNDSKPSLRESLQKKGKRPEHYRPVKKAQSEYPGFEDDMKQSALHYSEYAKSLYKEVGISPNRKRANSARDVNIQGLRYKFKVVDIAKYTDSLKYGIFNWPVRYCSIGKKKPKKKIPKEVFVKEIHFDTLLRILKETDWMKTPLYKKYKEHGRWVHDENVSDPKNDIYSEIEVSYLSSTLHHMINKSQTIQEFNEAEGQAIIKKHWAKTMNTIKNLMLEMNMMYYWEKLRLHYAKFDVPENRPKIQNLEKLLLRCKKLYDQINSFMKIFKLIEIKQLHDQQHSIAMMSSQMHTAKALNKKEVLIKRLMIAICLLLKENPILPLSFNYGGQCLLEQLKRERDQVKVEIQNLQQV